MVLDRRMYRLRRPGPSRGPYQAFGALDLLPLRGRTPEGSPRVETRNHRIHGPDLIIFPWTHRWFQARLI